MAHSFPSKGIVLTRKSSRSVPGIMATEVTFHASIMIYSVVQLAFSRRETMPFVANGFDAFAYQAARPCI